MSEGENRVESYTLVIGNKNYSSWSLRPWLAMRRAGLAFDEVKVELRAPGRRERLLAQSPSGMVPVLRAGSLIIWDSLAILEFLAERHPECGFWPAEYAARAVARSAAAEMHSGFQALRSAMPMDFVARRPTSHVEEAVERDIRRIVALWRDCRQRFGAEGRFLFGAFTNADAMYAPVASRFRTYVPDLRAFGDDGTAAAYVEALFSLPEMAEWEREAQAELAAADQPHA